MVDHPVHVQRPAGGVDDRVGEVLGDDVKVRHRGDLRRGAAEAPVGRVEDGLVPTRHQLDPEHRQGTTGDGEGHQPALVGRLQHHRVDGEEHRPQERRRHSLGEPEEAVGAQGQQDRGHDQPTGRGDQDSQEADLEPPLQCRVDTAQHCQPDQHGADQAGLLHHLARVLQVVDQEAEDRPWHDVEQGLLQQVRQRPQSGERTEQVHRGDQHGPCDGSSEQSATHFGTTHTARS